MVNILLVSHSHQIAKSVYEFVLEMKQNNFDFEYIGGIDNGQSYGTDPTIIKNTIINLTKQRDLLIIYDLGSSLLNTQLALQMIDDNTILDKVHIVNCAFLEGSLVAVTSNVENASAKELKGIIEKQCQIQK